MDTDMIKQFNAELSTLFDSKNMSKNKIQDISKAAIKAHKQYKHVVFAVERLMTKSKPEQRITVLYVVDSIIRASKHQLKDRDTFGPRFLKQFDKFLEPLLKCGSKEKLKMVRVLNLWMSNKVYSEAEVQPFRDKCKKAGLIIDFEKVEQAVKGKKADLSLYSGTYKKRTSSAHRTARTPPMDDGLLGAGPSFKAGPDIPNFVLSEELINGTISEREMLELVQKFGIDRQGVLSKDRTLLQKVLQVFVSNLSQKIAEIQAEKKAKNGNSIQNMLTMDFEYSDDEEEKDKEKEAEEKNPMSHDDILGLAQTLITQPAVLTKVTEVFIPTLNPFGLPIMPSDTTTTTAQLNLGAPPPNLLGLPPGFPNIPGLNPQLLTPQNAQLLLQQRAAQLQALQNNPNAQRNFLMIANPLLNPFAALQQGVNPGLLNDLAVAQQQAAFLAENENSPEKKLMEEAKREKEREKESKERKRMGLPAVKFGFTIIASRTLWLKKIPTNIVENDLKQAVEKCGEASRVKVIGNRACAFITMETRKSANDVVQKLREVSVAKKMVKVYWGRSPGMDQDQFSDLWDSNKGVWEIPYEKLPADLVAICEGAMLDLESLPEEKKNLYKENGESVVVAPPPSIPPPVPQPPPMSFPFQIGIPQPPRPPGIPPGLPPGVPPMFNLTAPPPPGMQSIPGFPPAPPPPGLGPPPPQAVPPPGFDPNKPPPMFQQPPPQPPQQGGFNPNAPPPPFGRGAGGGFPPPRGAMHHGPPPSFGRGGLPPPRGNHHFDSPRRGGGPPQPYRHENGGGGMPPRGRLLDQSEMWNREQQRGGNGGGGRDYDRDRSSFDRRRNDDGPNRRRSRWGDDEENNRGGGGGGGGHYDERREPSYRRRSSPRSPDRRQRRSPSYERADEKPAIKKTSAEEAMVTSTTLESAEEQIPEEKGAEPVVKPEGGVADDQDQTDEVPMDLE